MDLILSGHGCDAQKGGDCLDAALEGRRNQACLPSAQSNEKVPPAIAAIARLRMG